MKAGGPPGVADLASRFDRLWGDDSPPSSPVARPPPSATPPPRASGLGLVALEKVKLHAPELQRQVDSSLRHQGLERPSWPQPPHMRMSGDPQGPHPLSYLRLEDGSRLFMTQTLAWGGFGKVRLGLWEAPHHPSGGQVVALKELRLSHWTDFAADVGRPRKTGVTDTASAKRELAHLTANYSPLPVHGVIEHRGKLFISTPLLRDDVYDIMAESLGSSGLETLGLHIAYDGAEALAPLHAAGVLHRDIKPENLMHGPGNRLRLVDMGLATVLTPDRPLAKEAVGTPGYVAPEVLAGRGAGPKSDAWSLMVAAVNVMLQDMFISSPANDPQGHDSTADYARFHARLPRNGDGKINLKVAVNAGYPGWSDAFGRLQDINRPFADFVLNHGLHPDPAKRADVATIREVVGNLMPKMGINPADGADLLRARAAGNTPHQLQRQQLEAFAQALDGMPPRGPKG